MNARDYPRRKVVSQRGTPWSGYPYEVTLECGHSFGVYRRSAFAKAVSCYRCPPRANERIPVDELTRLAFIFAEQDRLGFAEAQGKGTPEEAQALEQARQFNAYRMRRWGRTQFEADIADAKLVSVDTLRAARPTSGPRE